MAEMPQRRAGAAQATGFTMKSTKRFLAGMTRAAVLWHHASLQCFDSKVLQGLRFSLKCASTAKSVPPEMVLSRGGGGCNGCNLEHTVALQPLATK